MRSNKIVATVLGTVLLGVTAVGGAAAAETVPDRNQPGTAAAAGTDAPAARDRALGELRKLAEQGVPGAGSRLNDRLKRALRTAERAVAAAHAHADARTAAQSLARSAPQGRGLSPQVDVPPPPEVDLDGLLEAVKSLDLGAVLAALTELLTGVLSGLTATVAGVTDTLSGITSGLGDPAGAQTALPEVPDMPELPDLDSLMEDLPEIPDVPDFPAVPELPLMPNRMQLPGGAKYPGAAASALANMPKFGFHPGSR